MMVGVLVRSPMTTEVGTRGSTSSRAYPINVRFDRQRGQSAGVQAVDIGFNMVSALAFS